MTNLQKGLQREIALFKDAIELDGGSIPEVSKAAFCKARKKLKPTAFSALSDIVEDKFYKSDEVQRWHGYRIVGVDGSTAELPGSNEIRDQYGVFKYRQDGKAISMGRRLMVYDTLNHITLYGALDRMEQSETGMLWNCLDKLKLDKNDIMVFDRYMLPTFCSFTCKKWAFSFAFV